MIRCLHCNAETSNGLALCDRCRATVLVDLEFIPVYFRNLARWRPGRAGSRPVPGSREPTRLTSNTSDAVGRALNDAGNTLTTWARALADDRPGIELPDRDDESLLIAALCQLFTDRILSMSTLDWVGEFATQTGDVERMLRGLTERVVPGWYAGSCGRCEQATYVVPGLTWVTCGSCGTTTYARDHIETILTEARGWVAPPRRIAEAVVALVDTELSVPRLHDRIRQWDGRQRIEPIRRTDGDGDPVGPKRYRLGDVLDRVWADGATRLDDEDEEDVQVGA